MNTDSIRYLNAAGFDYKPAESPDIWTHLESCFSDLNRMGSKFNPLSDLSFAELITQGEEIFLSALVRQHGKTGDMKRVTEILDLPYVVATGGRVSLTEVEADSVLRLVHQAGTPQEQMVHLLPTKHDALPCTHQVTIVGGLYADGHTVGLYGFYPGTFVDREEGFAHLATYDAIRILARDMESNLDEITVVTREEGEEMLRRVRE